MDAAAIYDRLWHEARAILARAVAEGRELTFEESALFERLQVGLDMAQAQLRHCRSCGQPI